MFARGEWIYTNLPFPCSICLNMPKHPDFHAFTYDSESIIREIVTEVGVSPPSSVHDYQIKDSRITFTSGLWDTGATNSAITRELAGKLGLKPLTYVKVAHAKGEDITPVYLVNFFLPNKIFIPNIKVTECESSAGNFGLIIGMDVITMGDFALTNENGKSTFSFRIPSIRKIDYASEARSLSKYRKDNHGKKLQRNDPCFCNSGKKYKDCHGKNF